MTQKNYDVLAIGNALVDILCSVKDDFLIKHDIPKGGMTLLTQEKAQDLYKDLGQTQRMSGGSAANTIAILAKLGLNTAYIGSVTNDELGRNFTHDIQSIDVDFYSHAPDDVAESTGHCSVLVTEDAQRTMCTYLGCAGNIPPEALPRDVIQSSKITYIEGYLWDRETTKESILKTLEVIKSSGKKAAISLSDLFCVDRHREDFKSLVTDQFDIIFANEDEITSLFQTKNFNDALQECKKINRLFALTRGEKGSVIVHGDQVHIIDAVTPKNLCDTTGAGDSFAAGFLYGLTRNMSYYDAALLGSSIASEIISHYGARSNNDFKSLASSVSKKAA